MSLYHFDMPPFLAPALSAAMDRFKENVRRAIQAELDTLEAPVAPPATDKPKPEEKETPEDIKKRARKPPAEGPCKGCGKNLPLNRLMLCYRCWVIKNLTDEAKARGEDFIPTVDAHPPTCGCTLPEHSGRQGGRGRG